MIIAIRISSYYVQPSKQSEKLVIFSRQKTIGNPITMRGRSLHTGNYVKLSMIPAPADHGIIFERADLQGEPRVPALWNKISKTMLSTTIGPEKNSVGTVEHLMAALFGLGISNVLIKVYGPEIPIMDGSSDIFVKKISEAGVVELNKYRPFYKVRETFQFKSKAGYVEISPSNQLVFDCKISFDAQIIGDQRYIFNFSKDSFAHLIADARTFCQIKDYEAMKASGLVRGGTLDNAVVVDVNGKSVINPEGLRYHDEFVRHKLLDAIGDLALLGHPLQGHVKLVSSGHGIHAGFMRALMRAPKGIIEKVTPSLESSQENELMDIAAFA